MPQARHRKEERKKREKREKDNVPVGDPDDPSSGDGGLNIHSVGESRMGASGDEKRRDSIAAEEAGRLDLLLVLLFLLLVLESGEGERDVSPHCSVPEGRESLCPVFLLSKRMVTMSLNLPPRGDDDQADTEWQASRAQVQP